METLAHVLSDLYPDEASIRRILADAGIDARYIDVGGKAVSVWSAAVNEARLTGRMGSLATLAATEYPAQASSIMAALTGEYSERAKMTVERDEQQPKGIYAQLDRIARKQDDLAEQFSRFREETAVNRVETNGRLKSLEDTQKSMQIDIRAFKHDAQAYVSNRALLAGILAGLVSFGLVAWIMFQAVG